jgi:hypothetical protein
MLKFRVIYKGETFQVHDMTDRCYICRDSNGKQVWILKTECEVI